MTVTYGTLTFAGFPAEVELVRRAAQTEPSSGMVASRTLRPNCSRQSSKPETRVWRVSFGPDGFAGILATFDAGKGAALPVLWTPPPPDDAGGAVPVRFRTGTLRVRKGPGTSIAHGELELEEVA